MQASRHVVTKLLGSQAVDKMLSLSKFALPQHCRQMNPPPMSALADTGVSNQCVDFVKSLLRLTPSHSYDCFSGVSSHMDRLSRNKKYICPGRPKDFFTSIASSE